MVHPEQHRSCFETVGAIRGLVFAVVAGMLMGGATCHQEGTAAGDGLRIGVAETEITPPVGYPQYRGISTDVTTPLKAKAIVFEQGDNRAAVIIADLIRITRDLSAAVRTAVSGTTNIPYHQIIVAATHTHTGPAYREDMTVQWNV